jgi:hypothetical protein
VRATCCRERALSQLAPVLRGAARTRCALEEMVWRQHFLEVVGSVHRDDEHVGLQVEELLECVEVVVEAVASLRRIDAFDSLSRMRSRRSPAQDVRERFEVVAHSFGVPIAGDEDSQIRWFAHRLAVLTDRERVRVHGPESAGELGATSRGSRRSGRGERRPRDRTPARRHRWGRSAARCGNRSGSAANDDGGEEQLCRPIRRRRKRAPRGASHPFRSCA